MRNALLLLFLVSVEICTSAAQVEQDRDAQSKIIALERLAKLQAMEAKDLKTLDGLLDERFQAVDPQGNLLTKVEALAFVNSTDSIRYALRGLMVRVHNGTAVVTGLYEIKMVLRGKLTMQHGRFVDTWLLSNGHWVAISSLATPENSGSAGK